MAGEVYINSIDIYTRFGAYILEGGYNSLIQWPSSKTVVTESYVEEDGERADLEHLTLKAKDISLSFGFNNNADIKGFYQFIGTRVYADYNFAAIGIQKSLRLLSLSDINYAERLSTCVIKVSDDNPMTITDATYVAPTSALPTNNAFKLDNKPLSDYGVLVLDGTQDKVRVQGKVKELLTRDISTIHGLLCDDGHISGTSYVTNHYEGKEMELKCVMIDTSLSQLWINNNALLYDWVRKKNTTQIINRCKRTLSIQEISEEVSCYYKSQTVEALFLAHQKYAIIFGLKVKITNN